ncbi:MAG: phosphoadenosine phosphosulfate reductase domain-containing protein [Candidatus Nezhaarchaeales archaeon]
MRIYPLYWCKKCNVPLLAKKCDLCQEDEIVEVKITPPGDVKPLFKEERLRLCQLIGKVYGEGATSLIVPEDKIVLLNKIPHVDLAYEVITDGHLMGLWKYDVETEEWLFIPHLEGARRLASQKAKRWIMVDHGAEKAISEKGRNLLAPGVKEFDHEINDGDYVYVVNEEWKALAIGKAVHDFNHRMKEKKGMVVKIKHFDKPRDAEILDKRVTWDDVIKANKSFLERRENEAIEFIQNMCINSDKPILVSFSGGKDSLVVLLLVKKALAKLNREFFVLFSNTGIEYPETEAYVNRILEQLGLQSKTIKVKAFTNFFDAIELFGPPARDFRWCCKTCKLAPAAYAIKKLGGECITFIGSRGVESIKRKRQGAIWKSIWVKGQTGASPIYNWSTLDVWLYLLKEGVELNPLYHKGLERIGCWVCPSMDLAEMRIVKEIMGESWTQYVEKIAEMLKLKDEEVKLGLWRWRFKRPKWVKEGKIKAKYRRDIQYFRKGEITVSISDFQRVTSILRTLYDLHIDEGKIALMMGKKKVAEILKNANNKVVIKAQENTLMRVFRSMARALACVKCRLCIATCLNDAIMLSEKHGVEILNDKCMACGECNYVCPVWAYSLKTPYIAKKLLE